MKILLTTLNSKFIHTNLAIRYISSYAKKYHKEAIDSGKIDISIKEFTINTSIEYILSKIIDMDIDCIAFSVYIWNVEDIQRLSKNIKKVNSDIKIIWGGPEVSYDTYCQLDNHPYIDYIIYGEGEKTFSELISSLLGEKHIKDVLGIGYRDNNTIKINDEMSLIENLEEIPSPFEDMNKGEYENKIVYYESSRGCPFNCQYCLSSAIKGLRYFGIDRVKKDLHLLLEAGVSQVKFIDRTFNANRKLSREIMLFLIENDNKKTSFHFEVTAHLIDDELLDFLRGVRPGLFQFEIGVQSTNLDTLESVGRVEDFDRLSKVVKKIKSYKNIHQHLDLIAGLPLEGYDRFSRSFDDVYALKSDCLQLGFLKMIKGTGIRYRSDVHGYEFRDYPPYEILSNKYITYKEISKLKKIEEILEIYYNSGKFRYSIDYLVDNCFERPFEFYEKMANYFEKNGLFDIALGREKLYETLYNFFLENFCDQDLVEYFLELLKLDYISVGKPNSIPKFMNRYSMENFKDRCHKFLQNEENQKIYTPKQYKMAAKNIVKYTHFEVFSHSVLGDCDDMGIKKKCVVLAYYDTDKNVESSVLYKVEI